MKLEKRSHQLLYKALMGKLLILIRSYVGILQHQEGQRPRIEVRRLQGKKAGHQLSVCKRINFSPYLWKVCKITAFIKTNWANLVMNKSNTSTVAVSNTWLVRGVGTIANTRTENYGSNYTGNLLFSQAVKCDVLCACKGCKNRCFHLGKKEE